MSLVKGMDIGTIETPIIYQLVAQKNCHAKLYLKLSETQENCCNFCLCLLRIVSVNFVDWTCLLICNM